MARALNFVGKCDRKIKGSKCGGNIVEYRVSPNADLMIVGPGQFAGYKCMKCGQHYSIPPLDPVLEKELKEKIKRIKKLNNKKKKQTTV